MRATLMLAFFVAIPANAALITIEADDYAVGTELTTLGDRAIIRRLSATGLGLPTYSPMFTVAAFTEQLGNRVISAERGPDSGPLPFSAACILGTGPCNTSVFGNTPAIRFDFLDGTDFFQIDGETNSDPHGVWAYDVNGLLLATCVALQSGCSELLAPTGIFGPFSTRTTISRDSRDISTVIVLGLSGATRIDHAVYSVPEPITLSLLTAGLLGMLASRRKNAPQPVTVGR